MPWTARRLKPVSLKNLHPIHTPKNIDELNDSIEAELFSLIRAESASSVQELGFIDRAVSLRYAQEILRLIRFVEPKEILELCSYILEVAICEGTEEFLCTSSVYCTEDNCLHFPFQTDDEFLAFIAKENLIQDELGNAIYHTSLGQYLYFHGEPPLAFIRSYIQSNGLCHFS
ncbi:MAG: hypothetical protein ACI4OH_05115 [Mitsuokella sp.]|uniref:hypothetical protein n=1 Tax=Mitsuokella sp. TaxID=2049034 RepID=UPI003EFE3FAF